MTSTSIKYNKTINYSTHAMDKFKMSVNCA